MKSKKKTKSPKKSLFDENGDILIVQDYCNKDTLKRAEKYLLSLKKNKANKRLAEKRCLKSQSERRVDEQVKLRCRQLPSVVTELRKALLKHDWNSVVTLTMILCHPGLKCYASIILRVCFILLLTHPKSNLRLLQSFIRHITGYILEEDVCKFIKILLILKKKLFWEGARGKFTRTTTDYKVTRDPSFENL